MSKQAENSIVVAPQMAAALPISNVQEMQFLGQVLSQSKLFGTTNPAEGLAIVAMCHQKRMSWLDFMETFHMIKGRVSKKTDAILADLHRIGGDHEIIERTPDKASAKFTKGKASYTSTITWEDCKQEPFTYEGKESDIVDLIKAGRFDSLKIKAKYCTPRSRKQMLWARCVSDGVRVVAPECCQGVYTPEEVDDYAPAPAAYVQQMPAAPSPSPAPVQVEDVEVCPMGSMKGQRWDSMEVSLLKQALNVPAFPDNVKAYIRTVIEQKVAKNQNQIEQQQVEAEVMS